jgi:putative endonuclease
MLTEKKTIGNFGEQLARNFLIARGYRIVDSNRKIGRWEIDIIAENNGLTIFVEVKTLMATELMPAENALTRRQIEILKKAIRFYCWRNKINLNNTRLDFIPININPFTKKAKLKHYQNIN